MSLRERTRPGLGIVEPCLPSPAKHPPSGDGWLHEIKHDSFRIMARRDSVGVRLITRNGNDFTSRFPIIVAAVTALPAQSFLIDGEAIVTNGDAARLQARLRGHRVEAAGLALSLRTLASLAEGQKSESAGSEAGSRRGLGALKQNGRTDGRDRTPLPQSRIGLIRFMHGQGSLEGTYYGAQGQRRHSRGRDRRRTP